MPLEPETLHQNRARLARLPASVHSVREKGKALLLDLLRDFFEHADDALFELADKAPSNHEQNIYFDSMREVRVQRRAFETYFVTAIDDAFAALASSQSASGHADTPSGVFSPMPSDALQEMIALDSAIARANEAFAKPIQYISMRLDSLVSVGVYQRNNPLGPEVLCRAFMHQTWRLDVGIKAKLMLFELCDKVVISKLGDVYNAIDQLLIDQGMPPSLQDTAGEPPAQPAPVVVESDRDQTRYYNQGSGPAADPELLAVLQPVLGEQIDIAQADEEITALVSKLFDSILEDRNLAVPMRELIGRLRMPILKVARTDKCFFTSDSHAARRLLNEMSTAALGWQADIEDSNQDQLFDKMQDIVNRLSREGEADVELFSELLVDFLSFLEKGKRRIAAREWRTLDAEQGTARAEWTRALVAGEVKACVDGRSLPPAVDQLVHQVWSNVMFVEGLKYGHGSPQWQQAVSTLEQLVWSVQPPRDAGHRQQLIELLPALLKQLRAGLTAISYDPSEMSALFASLQAVHVACILGQDSNPVVEAVPAKAHAAATLSAAEKGASQESAVAPEADAELPADDLHMRQVAGFAQGSWFEVMGDGDQPVRCRLAAFIKPTGKYIFMNRNGMKMAEKTGNELAWLLKRGNLRPLDSSMLFDRALETVVAGLRR